MALVCTRCTESEIVPLNEHHTSLEVADLVSDKHTVLLLTSDESRARQLLPLFRRPEFCDQPNRRLLAGSLELDEWMSEIFNVVVTTVEGAGKKPSKGSRPVKLVIFENCAPLRELRYTSDASDKHLPAVEELALPGMFSLEGMDRRRLQKQVLVITEGIGVVSEDSSAPLAFLAAMFRRLVDFPSQRALVLVPEANLEDVTNFIRSFATYLGWLSLKVSCLNHDKHPDYEVGVTSSISDIQTAKNLGLLVLIEADQLFSLSSFEKIMKAVHSTALICVHTPEMQPQFGAILSMTGNYHAGIMVTKPSHSLHEVGLFYAKVADEEDANSLLFRFLHELVTERKLNLVPVIQCRSTETVEVLVSQLSHKGFRVISVDDPRSQKFSSEVLVTTIPTASPLTIFYEMPATMEEYVTCAGHDPVDEYEKKGAINFVRPDDADLVKQIKQDPYGCTMLPVSPEEAYHAWIYYIQAYSYQLAKSQKSLQNFL